MRLEMSSSVASTHLQGGGGCLKSHGRKNTKCILHKYNVHIRTIFNIIVLILKYNIILKSTGRLIRTARIQYDPRY